MPQDARGRSSCGVAVEALHTELVRLYDGSDSGEREGGAIPDFVKLESLGYKVGVRLVARLTKERSPFPEVLDKIKFLCKDVWSEVFQKNIDKLQTNHRGVYVLQDFRFRWLERLSLAPGEGDEKLEALKFLVFPSGIIRGVLANTGIPCVLLNAMRLRLMFLGAPGVGKGTYASRIASQLKIPTISTGDLIRTEVRSGSALGVRLDEYTAAGQLVPNSDVIDLLWARLERPDCAPGYLLDGFPRNTAQAEALELRGEELQLVVYVLLGEEYLLQKLSGRRICSECGASWNVAHVEDTLRGVLMPALLPPHNDATRCECGGLLERRGDDAEDVVRERLQSFRSESMPLFHFYSKRGILRTFEVRRGLDDMPVLEDIVRCSISTPENSYT